MTNKKQKDCKEIDKAEKHTRPGGDPHHPDHPRNRPKKVKEEKDASKPREDHSK